MKHLKKFAALTMAGVMVCSLAACGSSDSGAEEGTTAAAEESSSTASAEAIQIATKPMTEQYILGEMLRILIEEKTDYTAEVTKGIGGGTSNIHPAMEKGEFDLYPEYTSSGWLMVLGHEAGEVSDEEMFELLQEEYSENYGMTWVGLYGFNNTYAIVVRADVAEEYDLATGSDLAEVADQLVFGGNPDYLEREDGFEALCDVYGFEFKDVKDVDISLKYEALDNEDIDVTNGYTTDAQLSRDTVVALEDDKNSQANYYCSTIVREDTLEEYPELEDTLMLMDGILSDKEMATLNDQVENQGMEDEEVARNFLIEKGLIEE